MRRHSTSLPPQPLPRRGNTLAPPSPPMPPLPLESSQWRTRMAPAKFGPLAAPRHALVAVAASRLRPDPARRCIATLLAPRPRIRAEDPRDRHGRRPCVETTVDRSCSIKPLPEPRFNSTPPHSLSTLTRAPPGEQSRCCCSRACLTSQGRRRHGRAVLLPLPSLQSLCKCSPTHRTHPISFPLRFVPRSDAGARRSPCCARGGSSARRRRFTPPQQAPLSQELRRSRRR
jgi:hypothetical protein